jgi:hypothetical protein
MMVKLGHADFQKAALGTQEQIVAELVNAELRKEIIEKLYMQAYAHRMRAMLQVITSQVEHDAGEPGDD